MKDYTLNTTTTSTLPLPTLPWAAGILIWITPLLTTFLIFLLPLFFTFLQKHKQVHHHLPPGPKPWPLVGNTPSLFRNKPVFRWIHSFMNQTNANIACIRLGNSHVIPVTCPEIAREFLKKHDALFASRPLTMATECWSHGYLSMAVTPWGNQWKKMRKLVASEILSPAKHRWTHSKRIEEADNLIRYLYNMCRSNVDGNGGSAAGCNIDVRLAARQYSGNVIRNMMFGRRYLGKGREDGGPGVEEVEHVDALFTVITHIYSFSVSDYVPWLRCLDLDGHGKVVKRAVEIINKYHDPIIQERMRMWGSYLDGNGSITGKEKDPQDLLDVLILAKDSDGKSLLTMEELRAIVADLVIAPVDSVSNNAEWALAEMINQPKILRNAIKEIDEIVGRERLVQESDLPRLNYVKACCKEAFRLHPFHPFNLPHVSSVETTVAGYFIPKGSHVLLSRIGLGRNPKVWDDPLRFKPERHLADPTSPMVELVEPELRFISFSTGRRGCVGILSGTAMVVMLLARLLQGFDWGPPLGQHVVDLSEGPIDLCMARPLVAFAKPRLSDHMYPKH